MSRLLFLLIVFRTLTAAGASVRASQSASGEIVIRECLAIQGIGRGARSAVHRDPIEAEIVAGTWHAPSEGEVVSLPGGPEQRWTRITVNGEGWFEGPALEGGYAAATLEVPEARTAILQAEGSTVSYINGEIHAGDPYQYGYLHLPVVLRQGRNELLFPCGRGRLRVRLGPARPGAYLDPADPTLPDLKAGEREMLWGAVVVVNPETQDLTGASIRAGRVVTPIPVVPALSSRKIGFRIRPEPQPAPGTTKLRVTLRSRRENRHGDLDSVQLDLRVRKPGESYKQTFVSDIDGSTQYYAVNPARAMPGSTEPPALFLTLHGAGVEAIGQADAYSPKSWGDLVAPTNRRPFGFDWEDWGRLDAMEVLADATRRLRPDPQRIYLTGHSMGGHGTWQVGVQFPGRFAAIGPSAGWISFQSYAGAPRAANPTPVEALLQRAASPSDTHSLEHNLAQSGVYILHGTADDNVPVGQARTMAEHLKGFHHDWILFEQPGAGHWWDAHDEPGADAVDWAPMFDFFAHHALPPAKAVRYVDFTTANPAVSDRYQWARIESQPHPLQVSNLTLQLDPGLRRFSGTTHNVARLALDLRAAAVTGTVSVVLDGQKVEAEKASPDGSLRLARRGEAWSLEPEISPDEKRPERCGPFKEAFRHRMLLVYGTAGTPEENAWSRARARFDAEQFYYRGNGSVDMVADRAFDPQREPDRCVILYGNSDNNSVWKPLLGGSPIQVFRDRLAVGKRTISGENLACLFLRPRPGSEVASIAAVSGTGMPGLRLTERLSYFTSGVEFPDWTVIDSKMLTEGSAGIRAAGFFGPTWAIADDESVWTNPVDNSR